jgi:hypothetical protein
LELPTNRELGLGDVPIAFHFERFIKVRDFVVDWPVGLSVESFDGTAHG